MPGIAITQATAANTIRLCMSPAPSVPSTAPPRAALLYSPPHQLCDVTPGYYVVPDPAGRRRARSAVAPAAVGTKFVNAFTSLAKLVAPTSMPEGLCRACTDHPGSRGTV